MTSEFETHCDTHSTVVRNVVDVPGTFPPQFEAQNIQPEKCCHEENVRTGTCNTVQVSDFY
jgi:hypothetical protein